MRRRKWAFPTTADFNTGDNEGSCYFHVNQKTRPALVGGARLPEAGARRAPICGWKPMCRSRRCCSTASAPPACASGDGHESVRGARQGRGHPVGRRRSVRCRCCSVSGIGPAHWLRRAGHSGAARLQKAWAATCRIICNCAPCSGYRREDAERDLLFAAGPRADGRRNMPCCGAGPMTMAASQLGIFTRPIRRRSAPISSSTSSPCRWTASARRCTAFPPSPSAPAICGPRRAARCGSASRRIRAASPRSRPTIFPPTRTAASPPMPSALTRRLMRQPALARYQPEEFRPGPAVWRQRCRADPCRRRYRHHHLPSRRHGEDGPGQRSHGGGR